jgi:hypothetical protein
MDIILYVLSMSMVNGTTCFPPNKIEYAMASCSIPRPQMQEVWIDGRWQLQPKIDGLVTTTLQICYESICVRTYPKELVK